MIDVGIILKRFGRRTRPVNSITTRFELVNLGGMSIGRATYLPGWKWSIRPLVGAARYHVKHVGLVLSGVATAAFDDGTIIELRAGDVFYIPPVPHDSWVVGDHPTCRSTLAVGAVRPLTPRCASGLSGYRGLAPRAAGIG
jgi:hypothetical protein